MSHPENVRAPGNDGLLDVFALHILVERLFHQTWSFGVACKAKSNQLRFPQLANSRPQRLVQERFETQSLFQANETILSLERVDADEKNGDRRHYAQQQQN